MPMQTKVRSAIESIRCPNDLFSWGIEEAKAFLLEVSGVDHGSDVEAWEKWARESGKWDLLNKSQGEKNEP